MRAANVTYPIVAAPFVLGEGGSLLVGGKPPLLLNGSQQRLAKLLISGCPRLSELAKDLRDRDSSSIETEAKLQHVLKLLGCQFVVLDEVKGYDVIILDRGWGGVYQTAIDLWQGLNHHCRALLIAPVDPPYGYDPRWEKRIITPKRLGLPALAFASIVCLARSILRENTRALLFVSHRAMVPYVFDLIGSRKSVVHGDTYGEEMLSAANHLFPVRPREDTWKVVQELLIGSGEPWVSLKHAASLNWAYEAASENWFYTQDQLEIAVRGNPKLSRNSRVVLPFVDEEIIQKTPQHRERKGVLFTTTTRQDLTLPKGLEAMLLVRKRVPSQVPITCVLSSWASIDYLELEAANIRVVRDLPKAEMRELIASSIANCRISRVDDIPISVLDSLASETPTLISSVIMRNIPTLVHGRNCLAVEPGDTDLLAQCLNDLIESKEMQKRIGREGKMAVRRFTLDSNLWRFSKYLKN